MNGSEQPFGNLSDGREVSCFTLENDRGLTIRAINYGANLISVQTPDIRGDIGEITLGFDMLKRYEGEHPYFGATVGRFANRISRASFKLDGRTYPLFANSGENHLHGGKDGFNRKLWDATIDYSDSHGEIYFSRVSPDGEEGYPGDLKVSVVFRLDNSNKLTFMYAAETDKATPVNLTNHTYWNLSGPGGLVHDHVLQLFSDKFLEIDADLMPTGVLNEVDGTVFDFRDPKKIGQDIETIGGYDHCYVVSGAPGELRQAAAIVESSSGRRMMIDTTLPAIQFYTSGMLEDTEGRNGLFYQRLGALCLETGGYTNAVNIDTFPSTILRPGEVYHQKTVHTFGAA